MITAEHCFIPVGGEIGEEGFLFKGMSTDSKPTGEFMGKTIANGSFFFEIDTLDIKSYDADTQSWV